MVTPNFSFYISKNGKAQSPIKAFEDGKKLTLGEQRMFL